VRPDVRVGIGDACAVLAAAGAGNLLVTTDMLIEGVHFRRDWMAAEQIGWKALAASLSDIAAMGGEPTGAFLALGLPRTAPLAEVEGLRMGFMACAEAYRVDLLGGDTVASPAGLVLCVTVLGNAAAPVLRSTARPGDLVFLGRAVGGAAAGLQLLRRGPGGLDPADGEALLAAHREPRPQVALGRVLAARGLATAMIDVSDGVLQDLGHICRESGLGARIDPEAVPVPGPARRFAVLAGTEPLEWALAGGEEYCLLFCVPPARRAEALEACREEGGALIGRMIGEPGLPTLEGGLELRGAGYEHFAAEG